MRKNWDLIQKIRLGGPVTKETDDDSPFVTATKLALESREREVKRMLTSERIILLEALTETLEAKLAIAKEALEWIIQDVGDCRDSHGTVQVLQSKAREALAKLGET